MDISSLLNALILGLVEGVTEFLPISSTGHLIIVGDLLGFTGERAETFEIFIQLGAILAVVWNYRVRLAHTVRRATSDPQAQSFIINLFIAFLPAAVLGLLLHKVIKTYLFNPVTVASALVAGGLVILWVERRERRARIHSVDEMTWRDALWVGFAQSFALFPGVSRAGATIIGGMLSGLSRPAATEFSFFLAIPTMFAATLFDLYKSIGFLHTGDAPVFLVGFVVAFLSALVVVRALLVFVSRHDFTPFAYYRLVLGAVVLWYFW